MVKFVVVVTVLVGVCMLSFNYVKWHESTIVKQERDEWKGETERISGKLGSLIREKSTLEGRLRQACSLLQAAEISSTICLEPEDEGEGEGEANG